MYKAIVSAISVRPHPNADRLQLGLVHGHQVIVGLDTKEGEVGVFFPTDGQLSEEFVLAKNLYNESTVLKLGLPAQSSYGFFSDKRRVRAQSFRSQKSDGFWVPLDYLDWTGADLSELKVGDQIDTLNGKLVCQKYYTPATLRAMRREGPVGKPKPQLLFPKHIDTAQLRYYVNSIPQGALISITEKLHGTSGRYGNVLEIERLTGLKRLWDKLKGGNGEKRRWVHINGSRNVNLREETKDSPSQVGFYGTNEFRYNVTRNLSLYKGEILYFEIVGYVHETLPIMPPQPIDDSKVRSVYGQEMAFTYGCQPGEHKLYLYRITRLNEDGVETDLSWAQVKQRAAELGLRTVPEIMPPFVLDMLPEALENLTKALVDGASSLDSRHIREGVVLRVESEQGTFYYKQKSFLFGVLEGYLKDNDNAVDLEEAS